MSRYNDDGETSKKAPAFNTRSAKSVITGCDDKDGTKTGTVPIRKRTAKRFVTDSGDEDRLVRMRNTTRRAHIWSVTS